MIIRILSTGEDKHLFVVRMTLGAIFFAHGAQKTFGWFGGPGYGAMMQWFGQQHIPAPLAWVAIMAELLGGLGLMLGVLTRISALGIVVNMVVATLTVGLSNGLFMNWFANQRGEGIEFYLLAIVLGFILIMQGAGPWSFDRSLSRHFA
jgi:putative oxidoreductase